MVNRVSSVCQPKDVYEAPGTKVWGWTEGGGRVGGAQRGAVGMHGKVCLHAESANLAFPYSN